jgi:hypothetical protein
MPIHDWSRVDAGIFHDLHIVWIGLMKSMLNETLLPDPFYALAEPVLGQAVPDVLTLREGGDRFAEETGISGVLHDDSGESPVASSGPGVLVQDLSPSESYAALARHIVVKNSLRDDEVVAVIELVSRANKTSREKRDQFLDKTLELLRKGIHLVIVDLQAPTRIVPQGFHSFVCDAHGDPPATLPPEHDLQTVSYQVLEGGVVRSHLVPLTVGDPLPEMPVFLTSHQYVRVSLEPTYQRAFQSLPRRFRKILED